MPGGWRLKPVGPFVVTTHHWDISPISSGGVHSQVRVGKACNSMQSRFTLEVFQDAPCYLLYLNSNLLLHTVTPLPHLTDHVTLDSAKHHPHTHLTLSITSLLLNSKLHATCIRPLHACVKWLFQQIFFFVNYFIYLHSTFFWEFKCPQLIKLYQSIFFFSGLANIVKGSNLVSKI